MSNQNHSEPPPEVTTPEPEKVLVIEPGDTFTDASGHRIVILSSQSIEESYGASFLPPADELEKLHKVNPEIVGWIMDEATKEAGFRRKETQKINNLIFFEKYSGQVFGFVLGLATLYFGYRVILADHDTAGTSIIGLGITGLAVAFVTGRKLKENNPPSQVEPSQSN